ncbi:MAG: hypothetical protein LBC35_08060 [Coriobacteriales bacterium]|jgi:hypothetical protein|nr:hypothetical protein [Coriobacteriales bacterium]
MAQRNPMNDRYSGDGPQGKTRKSAAKLKPKTEAASSVHIEKKPTNKQERKAASKRRAAQMAAKEQERKRKAQERERAAKIAAGEEIEEPKKPTVVDKAKAFIVKPAASSAESKPRPSKPDTPEYRKFKRIYWILMGIGIVAVIGSFSSQFFYIDFIEGQGWIILMGIAYVCIIGAIVLDYAKIRKLQKEHTKANDQGKKSPKQLKHDEQKALAAKQLEESRKLQRELKRANSKIPLLRKPRAGSGSSEVFDAGIIDDDDYSGTGNGIETGGAYDDAYGGSDGGTGTGTDDSNEQAADDTSREQT